MKSHQILMEMEMTDLQRAENQSEKMMRQVSQFCRNFIAASQNSTPPPCPCMHA